MAEIIYDLPNGLYCMVLKDMKPYLMEKINSEEWNIYKEFDYFIDVFNFIYTMQWISKYEYLKLVDDFGL